MGHAMKKLDHRHYAWLCAATLLLLLAGCQTTTVQEGEKPLKKDVSIAGYHLGSLPRQDNVHKLFIPRATVLVREPHLQTEFINILISEFTKEQTFEVVPREEEADATLKTTITDIKMNSIQYVDSKQDQWAAGTPTAWRVYVHADVVLVDNRTGEELWRANAMRGRYDFDPGSDFLDARREAILQACGDLSKEICDNISEPW
jgi:hypothetical protein